jgi:hypothetical protein
LRHRGRAHFVRDHRAYSRPLDRNEIARILAVAEALDRRTRPKGCRNGIVGKAGLLILRVLLLRFLRRSDGLCCPSYASLQRLCDLSRQSIATGLKGLERAGIMRRTARLKRVVLLIGGIRRLTTVQDTNLYAFSEPAPHAHLLPVIRRKSGDGTATKAAQLVASLVKSLTAPPVPAGQRDLFDGAG